MITNVHKPSPLPALVKIREVADLLRLSRQSIHNLIAAGDLVAHPVNAKVMERQHVRVTRDSLLRFYRTRFGHSLERALASRVEA